MLRSLSKITLVLATTTAILVTTATAFTESEIEAGLIYPSFEMNPSHGFLGNVPTHVSDPSASNIRADCEEWDPNFISDFVENDTPIDWAAVMDMMGPGF